MSNADKPAYPTLTYEQNQGGTFYYQSRGMTERTLIAAMVAQGMYANSRLFEELAENSKDIHDAISKASVIGADALIEELQKEKK